jgi:hypothetical protein
MAFKYYNSEVEIRKGDRVLFHGEPGTIDLIVTSSYDEESAWHMREFGGGVRILEPKNFGCVFIQADQLEETEDLEFGARADDAVAR